MYASSCSIGAFSFYIISLYHQNKPPGMQTLLGRVLILVLNIFTIVCFVATAYIILFELIGSYEETVAKIVLLAG